MGPWARRCRGWLLLCSFDRGWVKVLAAVVGNSESLSTREGQ